MQWGALVEGVDKLGHSNKAGNILDYMNRQCGNPYTVVGTWKLEPVLLLLTCAGILVLLIFVGTALALLIWTGTAPMLLICIGAAMLLDCGKPVPGLSELLKSPPPNLSVGQG